MFPPCSQGRPSLSAHKSRRCEFPPGKPRLWITSDFACVVGKAQNRAVIIELPDLSGYPQHLRDYTHLKDVNLRRSFEAENGLYLAESNQVIARALQAGHRPRSLLLAPRWLDTIAPLLENSDHCENRSDGGKVPVFLAPEKLLEELVGFHLHRGAIASMQRPQLPSPGELLAASKRVLVLEDLVDHTNVGAAIRSAAGCGYDALLVTPSCADPLYRRAVRVSMGTIFQIPWTRLENWPDPQLFHDHGYELTALALAENATDLAQYRAELQEDPGRRVALVAGTEREGLKPQTLDKVDRVVRIEMHHQVDSLNVAAACALACWATSAGL